MAHLNNFYISSCSCFYQQTLADFFLLLATDERDATSEILWKRAMNKIPQAQRIENRGSLIFIPVISSTQ